ncbi:MAG: polysaccharide biosynthesis protein [Clostridia bacterium]|nr:polysaccharide biosynthesis protein [Clostridia bacterium]
MSDILKKRTGSHTRWKLVFYDAIVFCAIGILWFFLCVGGQLSYLWYLPAAFACILACRLNLKIYSLIWRYGGTQSYIRLLVADGSSFIVFWLLTVLLPGAQLPFYVGLVLFTMNLLGVLAIRMVYRYTYEYANKSKPIGKFLCGLIAAVGGPTLLADPKVQKIRIAIVGAGRVGSNLAKELLNTPEAPYRPCFFIDVNKEKIGRRIYGLPVLDQSKVTTELLENYRVQELVFAVPRMGFEEKKGLYRHYQQFGFKLRVYESPTMQNATGDDKIRLREFDIEELLFREPLEVVDERTGAFYRNKRVLITGGGGSIGSELCRQIAKMEPQQLVILDVYENGAYDVQQELKMKYRDKLDCRIEIVSVCNRVGLERVFAEYRPQVVLNAAAHKHVPLMEHNCIEAVENNVFGTLNTVELSEKYGVERVMMVSTDKAVNPTNVMGATKRMCEMIVQAHSTLDTVTTYSATRFGNVLGSAGSVIPLFKRQISAGGPVTLTDKRIIRYFMTIPEASQLVLQSAAMAKNGELFVLDMGKPIKILDLAENIIRLSGLVPHKDIEIVETGLREGEKLYEELLVDTRKLDKTDNNLIFVEHEAPITMAEMNEKLRILREAVATNDDEEVRRALHLAVPTFKTPEEVNAEAQKAREMKEASGK